MIAHDGPGVMPWLFVLHALLLFGSCNGLPDADYGSFNRSDDIASQSSALDKLRSLAKADSVIFQPSMDVHNQPWTNNVSYCHWFGVSCCGAFLSNDPGPLCNTGVHSVMALSLIGAELAGTLPDVWASFPDLQFLELSANRGVHSQTKM